MSLMTDLIPWTRNRGTELQPRQARDPFTSLQREINRVFDDMWRGFDAPLARFGRDGSGFGWPSVELHESDKELTLTAELPGMSDKDVEILLEEDSLILRGERRSAHTDNARQFSEFFYGRFERQIPLPVEVQADKVAATFKDGLLTVTLPKAPDAKPRGKRIAIQKA